ncbi:MAG: hypothetical protein K1X61_13410 [Chitinophagales bacterium]|nr:hypothetical protein [Chitinophagales bacterium]
MTLFDNYTLKARIYPIAILFLPIIVIGIAYSIEVENIFYSISSLGIGGVLTYLFSQLGRDMGKLKEKGLWQSWGGPPTTIILRLSDSTIDSVTKKRYHTKLLSLCPVIPIPSLQIETTTPQVSDEAYAAWTRYLLSRTRDSKSFPLLLKENTSYGFRRNLWGLKLYGITICLVVLIFNYVLWLALTKTWNPVVFPYTFHFSTIVLIAILLFWIVVVTKAWIKIIAFAYADRLLETTEILN